MSVCLSGLSGLSSLSALPRLPPRIRIWSRDNAGYAKVRRIGFALAPEFGGTIHGYCGDTLDAGLLDLLEWHRKPSMEDMHKAYVGKSRTRKAEHTLMVQPYSPHLFRKGELPGPTLLMDVLRKAISTEGAQKAWKKVEKVKQAKKDEALEQKWIRVMPLPCRGCSDEFEQSTWKPMSSFTTQYWKMDDLWKHIVAKGQDLQCLRCLRKDFLMKNPFKKGAADKDTYFRENPMMQCAKCKDTLHHSRFEVEMQDNLGGSDRRSPREQM